MKIRARQEAGRELAPQLDFREALALAGAQERAAVHTEPLVRWAEGPPRFPALWPRAAAAALTTTVLGTGALALATGDTRPFLYAVALQIFCSIPLARHVEHALHAAEGPARELDVLALVLAEIEGASFTAPRLLALQQRLTGRGGAASPAIRRLHRLVEWHDWQHNPFFVPIGMLLLWGTHLALAIDAWRRRHGADVRRWLEAAADTEALASLAAYRFEHPADVDPELVEGPAHFAGEALAHPLLPAARATRNDVNLASPTRLLVVSGSNMSGKSTLLRTVGVNTVLALAGAPVRARALALSPLAIGATLRIQDSLIEGRSRFYAEISRIRELADIAAGPLPLLFLLDEIFHGTNSHDRLTGAAGLLKSLLARGAIGLITTHDLALTAVADELAPAAVNVHFEDWFEGHEMRFDYLMKPGPVTHSNALALMRAVGLDV